MANKQRKSITILLAALFILSGLQLVQQDFGPETENAKITEITDGDTVKTSLNGGETIRVLGIDTPEIRGENNPKEFYLKNNSETRQCLKKIGEKAAQLAKEKLESSTAEIIQDPRSDQRGDYGRLLAYIEYNQKDIGKLMLEKGYARVYNSSFSRKKEYREIETESREEGRGLWSQKCVKK